ncbi:hypothetical protein MY10362_008491 [Beauveria mimosiformis]
MPEIAVIGARLHLVTNPDMICWNPCPGYAQDHGGGIE